MTKNAEHHNVFVQKKLNKLCHQTNQTYMFYQNYLKVGYFQFINSSPSLKYRLFRDNRHLQLKKWTYLERRRSPGALQRIGCRQFTR